MTHLVRIGRHMIGDGKPTYIVAEGGVNHSGDPEQALRLMDAARQAGADAVKFQKRSPEALLTAAALSLPYEKVGSFGKTYGAHRDALELPARAWEMIALRAVGLGLDWFASPWDAPSVDFLVRQPGCCALKVASACLTDLPLLDLMAQTGLPIIMSTGMADLGDVEAAVATVLRHHDKLVLMGCCAAYPADNDQLNLRTVQTLKQTFQLPTGWSGHERGVSTSVCAVALGANVIERHLTLDRTLPGPDHAASLEPKGFAELVRDIRKLEVALGDGVKRILPSEQAARARLAKSVVTTRALTCGHVLAPDDLTAKGPGTGLSPRWLPELVGREVGEDVAADTVLPVAALRWPRR